MVVNTDEEEMGLEPNVSVPRLDTATFPSGAHGHPGRAEAHCDFGGSAYAFFLQLLKSSLENVGCCFQSLQNWRFGLER